MILIILLCEFAYTSLVVPSGKPIDKPEYCVIKFSVGDEPGTLVRALKVFHVSLIKFMMIVQTGHISNCIWENPQCTFLLVLS